MQNKLSIRVIAQVVGWLLVGAFAALNYLALTDHGFPLWLVLVTVVLFVVLLALVPFRRYIRRTDHSN